MRNHFVWAGVLAVCVVVILLAIFFLLKKPQDASVQPGMGARDGESAAAVSGSKSDVRGLAISMPPPNTPIALVVKQLEKPALQGSPHAACRIAQEAWRCSTIGASLDLAEVLANVPPLPNSGEAKSLPENLLNQAESTSALCSGTSQELSSSAYQFQKIAADKGGESYQRWLLTAPALRQDRFLMDIEGWTDYRNRAERYVKHAIESRNGDDLLLLLAIYAPNNVRTFRPPYQVEDSRTFLALVQAAETNQLAIPSDLKGAADRVRENMSAEELAATNRIAAELSSGWRISKGTKTVSDLFEEQQGNAFCN